MHYTGMCNSQHILVSSWLWSHGHTAAATWVFLSRNYGLIVAPQKFDVRKTNICPRSKTSRANVLDLRTSNFQGATLWLLSVSDPELSVWTLYCPNCSPLNFLLHSCSKIIIIMNHESPTFLDETNTLLYNISMKLQKLITVNATELPCQVSTLYKIMFQRSVQNLIGGSRSTLLFPFP